MHNYQLSISLEERVCWEVFLLCLCSICSSIAVLLKIRIGLLPFTVCIFGLLNVHALQVSGGSWAEELVERVLAISIYQKVDHKKRLHLGMSRQEPQKKAQWW